MPLRSLRRYAPTIRFSRTVRSPSVPRPSGTWAMPRAATWSGRRPRMSSPSKTMRPPVRTVPLIARRVVVFPAPFAPRMPTAPLSGTLSETPSSTCTGPYDAVTSWSSSSVICGVLPDVRLDDARVGLRFGGRPLHELGAVVEHDDAVGESGDEAHVVLEDDDGDVVVGAQPPHRRDQRLHLGVRETGRGLVEQQQLRLHEQRAAELDALVEAVRQLVCGQVRSPPEAVALQQLQRLGAQLLLGAPGTRDPRRP